MRRRIDTMKVAPRNRISGIARSRGDIGDMAVIVTLALCAVFLLIPVGLTFCLSTRWLVGWMVMLVLASSWAIVDLGQADGPGGMIGYVFLGLFLLLNVPAVLIRLLILAMRR